MPHLSRLEVQDKGPASSEQEGVCVGAEIKCTSNSINFLHGRCLFFLSLSLYICAIMYTCIVGSFVVLESSPKRKCKALSLAKVEEQNKPN